MDQNEYLNRVAEDCMEVLTNLSIPYRNVTEFVINRRAKRWGQCKRLPDGFRISINHLLVDGKHEDGLRETLYHELLHTCPDCMNHGQKWKRYASTVKCATGYSIKRANTAEEKGLTVEEKIRPAKYVFRCTGCGEILEYHRKCKMVVEPWRFRCANCHGTFERIK